MHSFHWFKSLFLDQSLIFSSAFSTYLVVSVHKLFSRFDKHYAHFTKRYVIFFQELTGLLTRLMIHMVVMFSM